MKAKSAVCFWDQAWKLAFRSHYKRRLDKSNALSYFKHVPIPLMSRQFGRLTGATSREALSLFLQEERAGLNSTQPVLKQVTFLVFGFIVCHIAARNQP